MHCFSLFTIEYYIDYRLVVGLCAASAAAAIAIVQASKGQVMMPRHHCLPCRCCRRARASTAAAAIADATSAEKIG